MPHDNDPPRDEYGRTAADLWPYAVPERERIDVSTFGQPEGTETVPGRLICHDGDPCHPDCTSTSLFCQRDVLAQQQRDADEAAASARAAMITGRAKLDANAALHGRWTADDLERARDNATVQVGGGASDCGPIDPLKALRDAYGVTEDNLAELEQRDGYGAARIAADQDLAEFVEKLNLRLADWQREVLARFLERPRLVDEITEPQAWSATDGSEVVTGERDEVTAWLTHPLAGDPTLDELATWRATYGRASRNAKRDTPTPSWTPWAMAASIALGWAIILVRRARR